MTIAMEISRAKARGTANTAAMDMTATTINRA
jgi:hypothetical protein